MEAIRLESTNDKFIISIDKNIADKTFLFNLLNRLRIEYLAQKVNFDEQIVDLGEDIKADWWEKNKSLFVKTNSGE